VEAALPAQRPASPAAPGPLGIADATARSLVSGGLRDPQLSSVHGSIAAVRHAYERLPASTRAAAVTAALGWAKAYVNSPAFTTAYAAARQKARPAGLAPEESTVDEELKQRVDEKLAGIAESRKTLAAAPGTNPKDVAAVLADLAELEKGLTSPATLKAMRDEITERRTSGTNGHADLMTQWNATYPIDGRDFVKRLLQQFLDASARVDFALPITVVKSPAGAIVGFAAPREQVFESWIDVECLLAGQEAVTAARTAADVWLTELAR
jgi:hypothetical protein